MARRLGWAGTLLLHGLLVGIALTGPATRPPRRDVPPTTINVHLVGMVASRQSEERTAAAPQETRNDAQKDGPKPARPAHPPAPPRSLPRSAPPPPPVNLDAIHARARPAETAPANAAAPAAPAVPPAPPADARRADEAQPARSLRPVEDDATAIRRYVAALGKALQGQLAYPAAARGSGATGAPLVAFTLLPDGSIEPGSLRLQRSCGYALLDDEALRTVRAGAPFSPPPKRLAVVVALAFVKEP